MASAPARGPSGGGRGPARSSGPSTPASTAAPGCSSASARSSPPSASRGPRRCPAPPAADLRRRRGDARSRASSPAPYPDRSPGTAGAARRRATGSATSSAVRLHSVRPRPFDADDPRAAAACDCRTSSRGARAVDRQTIVVMAHRDDTGDGPGANDNASGTAALIELARALRHRAERPRAAAREPDAHDRLPLDRRRRVRRPRRGSNSRRLAERRERSSPSSTSTPSAARGPPASSSPATARARRRRCSSRPPPPGSSSRRAAPARPSALGQLVDLGFPFSLYEQAPFLARGRPRGHAHDRRRPAARPVRRHAERLDVAGSASSAARRRRWSARSTRGSSSRRGTSSYVYSGSRIIAAGRSSSC